MIYIYEESCSDGIGTRFFAYSTADRNGYLCCGKNADEALAKARVILTGRKVQPRLALIAADEAEVQT